MRLASKPRTTESRRALYNAIRDRVPFTSSGALSAEAAEGDVATMWTGRLSDEHRATLRTEQPTYLVFSYGTPIGWWSEQHGWTVPDARYSVTTSHHQSAVRLATTTDLYR